MSSVLEISASSTRSIPAWKRVFDIAFSALLIVLFSPLLAATALAVKMTSKGSTLHWSSRIGQNNRIFCMPKFRTMRMDTPQIATHLMKDPANYVTPIGRLLRKTSLDELPQLFSVVAGDLSLVGPRPALFNQADLVALRTHYGIDSLVPGITGWAQVNGRDELSISDKVGFDRQYLESRSFWFDLKILLLTTKIIVLGEGVSH